MSSEQPIDSPDAGSRRNTAEAARGLAMRAAGTRPLRRLARLLVPQAWRARVHTLMTPADKRLKVRARLGSDEYGWPAVERWCLEQVVPISSPLVLISQIQRSGGTLLSRLFDHHPQLLAHPHELKMGYSKGRDWPVLDLSAAPSALFETVYEPDMLGLVKGGYHKGQYDERRYPFFLLPRLQRDIFVRMLSAEAPASDRQVFDAYFTAYFNAWLNYRGWLDEGRYVTGFTPRLAEDTDNVDRFFRAYPDGVLIQILREPVSWYASASRHRDRRGKTHIEIDIDAMLGRWLRSAEAILANRSAHGPRVVTIRFESLVRDTELVMHGLATRLGIAFQPILLEPTFNGQPIRADSSFAVAGTGIVREAAQRTGSVTPDERHVIERTAGPLYEQCAAAADL